MARRLRLPRVHTDDEPITVPDPSAPHAWRTIRMGGNEGDRARAALAAVFEEPHGDTDSPTLFDAFGYKSPGFVYTRPRLGYCAASEVAAWRSPEWLQCFGRLGERVYACTLTRRPYALPIGAPVPCLFLDFEEVKDTEDGPVLASPSDCKSPASGWEAWPIHPALAIAGPAAVLKAVEQHAVGLLHRATEGFETAGALLCLTSDPSVSLDAMEGMPIAEALSRWDRVEDPCGVTTFQRKPVGWRSLGYVRGLD
ncbi:MAG: hypothetical protein AAFV01_09720 [Bacteroidota bacterium]